MSTPEAVLVEALEIAHGPLVAVNGVSLSVSAGEILTLLGPSGCGKTTTLRAIAGLEHPRAGRIAVSGRTVFDARTRFSLPPERRGLAMVFQSYAIWPHLTVFENVAFPLRARRVPQADIAASVCRSLDLVGLRGMAGRPATRLSGGQQQRVALARAIAAEPAVILLDEPLSNLDAQLRLAMRVELKALQRRLGLAAIYVTHDQEEALALSDRLLVMKNGLVEQAGRPEEIHAAPRSRFVASFMGVRNIFECAAAPAPGGAMAHLAGGLCLTTHGPVPHGPAYVAFRPISVELFATAAPGAHPATLAASTHLGELMQHELRAGELTIVARSLQRGDLTVGGTVWWRVPPEACFLVAA